MADGKEPAGEGGAPQDPAGGRPQDPGAGEGGTVNRHQYERDIANRDRTIGELRAEVERLKGEGGRAADAMRAVEELRAQLEDERTNSALAAAGCVNAKAAKALLGDYEGDVARLKEVCPYLFGGAVRTASTGGEPAWPGAGETRARARRAAGLKD